MFRNPIHIVLIIVAASAHLAETMRGVHAQEVVDQQYIIKASYIYHFTNFVDWPDDAFPDGSKTLTIGVLGTDPFGRRLTPLNGKTVKGRQLVIRRFGTIEELQPCQVLFVSASERNRLSKVHEALKGSHTLTISDMRNYARHWGMINFVTAGNNIRFEVNVDAARRAGLQMSSRMLSVATTVKDEHPR